MDIDNEKDYESALQRLEVIFDAKMGSAEGEELEILSVAIEKYENRHYPINY